MSKIWAVIKNKFIYAIRGIWITIKEEKSLWNHIVFTILVVAFGYWLKISSIEWVVLVLAIGLVAGFELLNTSLEAMMDMISYQYNLKAKKVKDIAAGATLIVSIAAIIVGLIIFLPKIIAII